MKINNRISDVMMNRISKMLLFTCMLCLAATFFARAQDHVPREYTNPDEVVTFDRTTPYVRAIDVINQFAQQYAGKAIIDRTDTDGNLGISVPPMHWRDALNLILQSKYLQIREKKNYFEIIKARVSRPGQAQTGRAAPDTALSTHSKEVRINAIFFEGNRRALQEVGVDWSTLTDNVPSNVGEFVNGQGGGSGGGQLPSTQEPAGGGQNQGFNGPFVSVNSKGAQSVSQNVFNSLINFGDVFGTGIRVQALFSAFQADNLGKILTSPSVKVLEGQEGHIQVGQDFSIKQRDFAGNVTDKFFSVGTILNVTPEIIEQQDTTFIHLNIEAEKSSAQPDPVSTIINKQNASTQSLLLDGESTVIAGLYRTESTEVRRGVPILKDLPAWFFGLRYLFGYNSKDFQTRELVILIQASIVPGIPERMNQDHMPGKIETLQRARERAKRDIQRYQKALEKDETKLREDVEPDKEVPEKPAMRSDDMKNMREDSIERKERSHQEIPSESIEIDNGRDETSSSDVPNAISKKRKTYGYYVVAGSFRNKQNAESKELLLQQQGYDPETLVNAKDGFYMVAYKGFKTRKAADHFLERIKRKTNSDAWVYNNY